MKNTLRIVIALFLSVMLSSCLSVSRNIKINKDGSGNETFSITFQKEFYEMMSSFSSMMDSSRKQSYLDSLYNDQIFINETRNKYDSIPGVKILDIHSEKGMDSSNKIIVSYEFDSVSKIGSALNSLDEENKDSKTTVTWIKEGDDIMFDYLYKQSLKGDEDLEAMNDSLTGEMMKGLAEMFRGGSIDIQIEFPFEVVSSNAASTTGNILHWNYPMSDLIMNGKMELKARIRE